MAMIGVLVVVGREVLRSEIRGGRKWWIESSWFSVPAPWIR